MSKHPRKGEDPPKRIRVAIVSTSIAPYAIPEGERLASRPEITTRHFFARGKEPGRKWQIPEVPFPHEITAGFAIRLKRSIVYLPLTLPIRLFKFKPDIIVGEQLGTLNIFSYLYAIPARVPVLIRSDGTPHTEARRSSGLRKWVRRLAVSLASGFYYYTPGAERYLKSIGAKGPFFPLATSVDDRIFTPPHEAREENVLLFVGSLIPIKGVELLLQTFLEVLQHELGAQLWIVGDGPLKPQLVQMLPAHSKEHVRWFGFLGQQDTASLYRRASVFVIPTLLDTGPTVSVEAVMCGLPIVTTPFAGNSELLVREGENGFVVDPRDTKLFARAVLDVLHSPNKQVMYETSLMLAKRHTPEQTAHHLLTGILGILNGRAG
ncbi:MAG: glycosyltransferase family 4 protein [Terriglobales bacterium]|jgi:glycosyltransferase involved in cell wall biosynthesis